MNLFIMRLACKNRLLFWTKKTKTIFNVKHNFKRGGEFDGGEKKFGRKKK